MRPIMTSNTDHLTQFDSVRTKYRNRVNQTTVAHTPLSNTHGFFRSDPFNQLTERYAGFDKLFLTLINDVVEDPDYALRKDPKVYRRMLRDPQIYYCLEVRKAATTSLPWHVIPPKSVATDPKALELAAVTQQRLDRIPRFTELLCNMLDAILPGLSVNELVWEYDQESDAYIVKEHFPINKDRFRFDSKGNLRLLQPKAAVIGLPVPGHKFIAHTFNISDGSWARPEEAGYVYYGKGLADTPLYHYFYFKITALRLLLRSLERFSDPQRIFYTGGPNAALVARLDSILASIQNDSVVGIPGTKADTPVDTIKHNGGGALLYLRFLEYLDKLFTRAVLGQELMTEIPASGSGSFALGAVHKSVFATLAQQDKELLEDTLNRTLMKFDADLNAPAVPYAQRPRFRFKKGALEDAAGFLATVNSALSLGLDISEAQVRELTGLKKPALDEEVIKGQDPELRQQLQIASLQQPQTSISNSSKQVKQTKQTKQPKPQEASKIPVGSGMS